MKNECINKVKLRKIKKEKLLKRREHVFIKKSRKSGHGGYNKIKKSFLFKQLLNKNAIFQIFEEKNFYKKPKIYLESAYLEIPEVFSFSKNAFETINVLKELSYSVKNELPIFINHKQCKEIDLAASLVMDVILMEYKNMSKKSKLRIEVEGILSENSKVNEILKFSGILNNLGIIKSKRDSRLELLPLTKNEDSGIMTTKIIDYYNKCLNSKNFILNEEGETYFSTMIGEVISNCSDHGGQNVQWYALGHYTEKDSECNLTIFDFGNTIYEGLKNNTICSKTIEKLKKMTEYHKIKSKKVDKELLWTLFSLQHGISRLNSDCDSTRGQGTVDLIDSFQKLGAKYNDAGILEKPLMSITSGNINILFDGTYTIKENSENLKIIAFNENNDLKEEPDKKFVKNTKNFFPGTVISIKFFVDRKYIEEVQNNEQ